MRLKLYALLTCLLLVGGLAACSEDPTASGSGEPEAIVTDRSLTNQVKGTKFSIKSYAIDQNGQRMAGQLTATSAGAAVLIDSVIYVKELLETRVFINAANTSTAGTVVTISGHGLSKDVTVKIT